MLGQEALADKTSQSTAMPILLKWLAEGDWLGGARVSIDAIATNGTIAAAIRQVGADYLLALKTSRPCLRADIKPCFNDAPAGSLDRRTEHDKGHGPIDRREIEVIGEVKWLSGDRRFPAAAPDAASSVRVRAATQRGSATHTETQHHFSSAILDVEQAGQTGQTGQTGQAIRSRRGIDNQLHGFSM